LLISSGAAGIYGGVHYWKKFEELAAQHPLLERELGELKLKLEQLTNESVLWRNAKHAAPALKNEEVGASAPSQQSGLVASSGSDILTPLQTPAANATVAENDDDSEDDSQKNPLTPASPIAAAHATSGTAAAQNATPEVRATPSVQRSGFTSRIIDGQRMRLRYRVVSPVQQPLNGSVTYQGRLEDGATVKLEPVSAGDRFSITNMKNIETQVKSPSGISVRSIKAINVIILLEEGDKVLQTFPTP
jgi:hypothetical protein